MNKNDVPLMGRPGFYIVSSLFLSVFWVALLLFVPDTRPGLLELGLGACFGVTSGALLSRLWLNYLSALVPESKRRPWTGWGAAFAHPAPPLGPSMLYRVVGAAITLASFFAMGAILTWLYHLWPDLGWPYARFADATKACMEAADPTTAALGSLTSSMLIFFGITSLVISTASIRWYSRISD